MLRSVKEGDPDPCPPGPSHSCTDWPAAQVTGGRNGYGAKLANIFSSEFTIETCDGTRKRQYRQVNLPPLNSFSCKWVKHAQHAMMACWV